jgi:hypothetical protein
MTLRVRKRTTSRFLSCFPREIREVINLQTLSRTSPYLRFMACYKQFTIAYKEIVPKLWVKGKLRPRC